MTVMTDLQRYLTRPIIPFCFGIPLLLPAILLTVVAFLQDHISTTLHVLGILLLALSVLSIAWGTVLGFRDVCRNRKPPAKRPVTRGFQKMERPGLKDKKSLNRNSNTPDSPAGSMPNSQSSSRRSPCSVGSTGSHLIVTNEMIRLVPNKVRKGKKLHRFLPRTSIRPSPKNRMPALEEEEQTHAGENGDVRRSATERNLHQLEKHLREVGLGMASTGIGQSPVDVEVLPPERKFSIGECPSWKNPEKGHTRSRSMPENEMHLMIRRAEQEEEEAAKDIMPGSVREGNYLRRSARRTRGTQDASHLQQQEQQQMPVLTSESHERTGVRSNIGNTLL